MKLTCTINGVEVEASEEAAKRLIASGSFQAAEKPAAPKRKAPRKKEE